MKSIVLAVGAALIAVMTPGLVSPATAEATFSCSELLGLTIPAEAIGLPTSGGEVAASQTVAPQGAVGEYCQVDADLFPVDPKAPSIKMRVALPVAWNNKALMFGGGGTDGTIPNLGDPVPFGPAEGGTPLAKGFAVFGSDSGHAHVAAPGTLLPSDHSFGANEEALRNFAGDALKKTRDAAMFLIGKHYGRPPAFTYFAGGSSGGREALAVAQKWPQDFDGIISIYPAYAAATLNLWFGYMAQVLSRPGAFPDSTKQKLLQRAVMQACDGRDGLEDGFISDEAGCDFAPETLRCAGGLDLLGCLSDAQIAAVKALSSPVEWGNSLASGERGYPGYAYLSGADIGTPAFGIGAAPPSSQLMLDTNSFGVAFWDQWVKHFVTKDPNFDSLSLDPRAPGQWHQRISELTGLQDMNNPDLRRFAQNGGKLILVHGLADPIVSHRATAQYVDRVRQAIGSKATSRSVRFYTIPGAGHGNGLAAFNANWDSVSALDGWVETGQAPVDPVVSSRLLSRPLCQYPTWPRYNGSGDTSSAASFTCVR